MNVIELSSRIKPRLSDEVLSVLEGADEPKLLAIAIMSVRVLEAQAAGDAEERPQDAMNAAAMAYLALGRLLGVSEA